MGLFRGENPDLGSIVVTPLTVDDVALKLQEVAGQTGDMLDVLASDGVTVLASINASGDITAPTVAGTLTGGQVDAVQHLTASGAATKEASTVIIDGAAALAITLVAPTAGAPGTGDDGMIMRFIGKTAYAHTVTTPADKINGTDDKATFSAAGDHITLIAYGGVWYTVDNNTTLSEV